MNVLRTIYFVYIYLHHQKCREVHLFASFHNFRSGYIHGVDFSRCHILQVPHKGKPKHKRNIYNTIITEVQVSHWVEHQLVDH